MYFSASTALLFKDDYDHSVVYTHDYYSLMLQTFQLLPQLDAAGMTKCYKNVLLIPPNDLNNMCLCVCLFVCMCEWRKRHVIEYLTLFIGRQWSGSKLRHSGEQLERSA